jgi:hypothetical protein
MKLRTPLVLVTFGCFAGNAVITGSSTLPAEEEATAAPEYLSQIAAKLIAEAIPPEYARTKDWGQTKQITSGLRSSGNFFDFDIHRRKKHVKHGVWKSYRVQLLQPEEHLEVRVENLRRLENGRIALTLFVKAKLHAQARAKVYERGVHLIAVEAEGHTSAQLWLEAEIGIESVRTGSYLPGIAVRPLVTDARVALDDLRLTRISDVRGPLVRELSSGVRRLLEDELEGPKLVAKINRSLEKRRDRLELTPAKLTNGL